MNMLLNRLHFKTWLVSPEIYKTMLYVADKSNIEMCQLLVYISLFSLGVGGEGGRVTRF